MLGAAVPAVMEWHHQRMLDSRLRGNDTVVVRDFGGIHPHVLFNTPIQFPMAILATSASP